MGDNDPSARELREKYQALLAENGRLREEIGLLKSPVACCAMGPCPNGKR